MIKSILIKGFKSIDMLDVTCNYLNIITGTNSSGKSTFLQALLLMAQNATGNIGLNGELIKIGDFSDAKNFNTVSKRIEFALASENISDYNLIFEKDEGIIVNDAFLDSVHSFCAPPELRNLRYLSCNRIGAEDIYRKNYVSDTNIGINGEYSIYSLEKNKSSTLPPELIADTTSYTLLAQVNYWLEHILGASVVTEDVIGTDYVKCFFATEYGKLIRPKNTGAGLSYLISVLVLCLLSSKDDTLVIENPEIHLHPQAQSRVCEFLYFIAQSGRQIFVETHSDHIFNGIRAGIATGAMDANLIAVNFFAMNQNNCTENNVITFGKRGRILNYKEGLFDQFDLDLNRMLGL